MINVAVLGYGTVGSGVVEVIETNKEVIDKRAGEELHVKYILDLRDFPGDPYEDRVVHDYSIILNLSLIHILALAFCRSMLLSWWRWASSSSTTEMPRAWERG